MCPTGGLEAGEETWAEGTRRIYTTPAPPLPQGRHPPHAPSPRSPHQLAPALGSQGPPNLHSAGKSAAGLQARDLRFRASWRGCRPTGEVGAVSPPRLRPEGKCQGPSRGRFSNLGSVPEASQASAEAMPPLPAAPFLSRVSAQSGALPQTHPRVSLLSPFLGHKALTTAGPICPQCPRPSRFRPQPLPPGLPRSPAPAHPVTSGKGEARRLHPGHHPARPGVPAPVPAPPPPVPVSPPSPRPALLAAVPASAASPPPLDSPPLTGAWRGRGSRGSPRDPLDNHSPAGGPRGAPGNVSPPPKTPPEPSGRLWPPRPLARRRPSPPTPAPPAPGERRPAALRRALRPCVGLRRHLVAAGTDRGCRDSERWGWGRPPGEEAEGTRGTRLRGLVSARGCWPSADGFRPAGTAGRTVAGRALLPWVRARVCGRGLLISPRGLAREDGRPPPPMRWGPTGRKDQALPS